MVNNSEMEEQDNPEKRQREERKQQNVFGDAIGNVCESCECGNTPTEIDISCPLLDCGNWINCASSLNCGNCGKCGSGLDCSGLDCSGCGDCGSGLDCGSCGS
ncbi:hypothetical protein [Floridanema evergladense]|uniref:Metallothionein n=1 Tax=Floridaenema evergladense BLCC-F167 TaxID=3153639 RepID=A0ABV4WWF7_9CYAN